MDCFFACFRFKAGDQRKPHGISNSFFKTIREHVVSMNKLVSLFRREEKRTLINQEPPPRPSGNNEAQVIKSCSSLIIDNPAEIRRGSKKPINRDIDDLDDLIPNFHSWLPSESRKQLLIDCSALPRKEAAEDKPSIAENDNFSNGIDHQRRLSSASDPGIKMDSNTIASYVSPLRIERKIPPPCSNLSPYPTPLKVSDEMQTPATVYPASLDGFGTTKRARVRTQFAFPISKPAENLSQRQGIRDPQVLSFDHGSESRHEEDKLEGSSRIFPKQWDGNGIPNSTNKYKEDQRVNWHATPFEMRLEKALSDDKITPERKPHEGIIVEFEYVGEESDTLAA